VPEIGLAIGVLMLAFLVVRRHRAVRANVKSRRASQDSVSLDAMSEMISELAPTLRETAKVTAPQSHTDRGHVWASPCGKRVYIN
jgi:hypothetical protein